ncbi:transglutaminaseTgpA domain-containing protein [Thermophilibacter sp.]
MGARGERDGRGPRRGRPTRTLALTPRGAVQLACGAALLAVGAGGGWLAPSAAGLALLAACAAGLAGVLLARRARSGSRAARLLSEEHAREESWVQVDQCGDVVRSLGAPGAGRGLYRQRSVRRSWHDAFGFWRATRTEPASRELRVPPAVSPELVRRVAEGRSERLAERTGERETSGVRPYERGDGLRQVAWRQSAHHGELMSFEDAGREAPGVLVVADVASAADPRAADELAATLAALLAALRRTPDVLLTDGELVLRTPVQQERFCAALVAGRAGAPTAEERARTARRLAGTGTGRRRVALVTADGHGPLAEELRRGPLRRGLVVVGTGAAAGAGPAREGRADDAGAPGGERDREGGARGAREAAAGGLVRELVALLACCALALLSMVPLRSMIREGVWEAPVALLLGAGAGLGALAGSLLRRRGARGGTRALVAAVLAAVLVGAGAAHALGLYRERANDASVSAAGVSVDDGTGAGDARYAGAERDMDAMGALGSIVRLGVTQLAGSAWGGGPQAWDLLVILAGAALAALACALASSRAARAAVALVPLALSAADQVVMGSAAQLDWVGAAVALGLALIWLSVCERPRPARALVVAVLSCALGWAGGMLAPAEGSAVWSARGTRVETLVDLSRDLRRRSSAEVLTYQTTSIAPVYLRLGVLDRFDGSTWRFSGDASEGDSPLARAGVPGNAGGWGTLTTPLVATTIWPLEGGGSPDVPVPPGTATLEATEDGGWRATGRYVRPIQAAAQADSLVNLAYELDGYGGAQGVPDDATLAVPDEVPTEVEEMVARARAERADASRASSAGPVKAGQVEAVRWLVSYFTDGSFSYSLDAPGGDGRDNLTAIGDFLERRSGYCTHYATAFALLARELGVPSRVALGYAPGGSASEDGTYTVTMRQLHAWAEVWVDGIGWVGVDVTPAATGADETGNEDATAPETGDVATPTDAAPTPEEPTGEGTIPDAGETSGDAAGTDGTDPAGGETGAGTAPWAAVAAGVAAALAAATELLAHRRRPAASWQELWERVCRAARRAHLHWGLELTEGEVAELICARLGDDERLAGVVRAVARNACLERYGR